MTEQTGTAPHEAIDPGATLRALETYWNDLRGTHRLPQRRDVEPSGLGEALPHAFLMQKVAPGIGRIRVAGQALGRLFGMDPRGMPLSAFFGAESRAELSVRLAEVFDVPAIVEIPVSSRRGIGRPRLAGRLLLLPLIGDDGMVSACLGALVMEGRIGTGSRRLDIGAGFIRSTPVVRPRAEFAAPPPVAETAPPPPLSAALAAGTRRTDSLLDDLAALRMRLRAERLARRDDPQAPETGAKSPGRPYLRLVVDNG